MSFKPFQFTLDPVAVPTLRTEHREIKTPIPCPGTKDLIDRLQACESRSMQGQIPLVWDRALDYSVTDPAGNRFIDFTSAIFLANAGHANPRVIAAVTDTLARPLLHAYNYPTEIRARYLQALVEFSGHGMEKAFLLSGGTEATEAAFKLMRLSGLARKKSRGVVIGCKGNYHGRTMGAQMLSANAEQKNWIGLQDPDVMYLDFPFQWALDGKSGADFFEKTFAELVERERLDPATDICGFILEVFQGWAAAFYPPDFVQAVRSVCDKHGLLLAFDEVQSGFGRTGRAFGYEHYGVEADLICCGKGIGSGFVLSAVIGRSEVMDLPPAGAMSSTHSANPVACSAGLATLEEIRDRNLVERAKKLGKIFFAGLNKLQREFPDRITHVCGKGLIAALHFGPEREGHLFASRVCEQCFRKGLLLVFTGRESIKFGPPLTIPESALREGLVVLREAIADVAANG